MAKKRQETIISTRPFIKQLLQRQAARRVLAKALSGRARKSRKVKRGKRIANGREC